MRMSSIFVIWAFCKAILIKYVWWEEVQQKCVWARYSRFGHFVRQFWRLILRFLSDHGEEYWLWSELWEKQGNDAMMNIFHILKDFSGKIAHGMPIGPFCSKPSKRLFSLSWVIIGRNIGSEANCGRKEKMLRWCIFFVSWRILVGKLRMGCQSGRFALSLHNAYLAFPEWI